MEANPATLKTASLRKLRRAGVNRLSIGLQSANNGELRSLGRIHTYEDFEESYRIARKAGFDNISVDLMYGIPNQTAEKTDLFRYKGNPILQRNAFGYIQIKENGGKGGERGEKKVVQCVDPFHNENIKVLAVQGGGIFFSLSRNKVEGGQRNRFSLVQFFQTMGQTGKIGVLYRIVIGGSVSIFRSQILVEEKIVGG
jgi:hypothetical protein